MSFQQPTSTMQRRHSLLYLLGAALQGLGIVLVQPFTIRLLGEGEWGRVSVSVSLLQVGLVVISAGLPLAVARSYYDPQQGPQPARSIAGFQILLGLSAGTLVGGVMLASAAAQHRLADAAPFVVSVVGIGLYSVVTAAQSILRAQQRPVAFVALTTGATIGAHLCGLAAITWISRSATTYLVAFGVGLLITSILSVLVSKPLVPWRHREAVREAVLLSLPVLPHSVALTFLLQGDVVLVKIFSGDAAAGHYAAAAPFALGVITLLAALNNVWTPSIMAAQQGDRTERINSVMRSAAVSSAAIAVVAMLAAIVGGHILGGTPVSALTDLNAAPTPTVDVIIDLAKVLPLVALGYALYLVSTSVLFAARKTSSLAWVTLVVTIVAMSAFLWPAQHDDLLAMGAIKVSAYGALGLAYLAVAMRVTQTKFQLGTTAIAATVSVAVSLALLPLNNTMGVGLWVLALGCAVGIVVLVVIAVRRRSSGGPQAQPHPGAAERSAAERGDPR